MNQEKYLKNLTAPTAKIDVVLDTDAYNEIDDQFAISYMLNCGDKINIKGICAAPFFNKKASSPKDGMEKSYNEILKLLDLAKRSELKSIVFKGSERFMEETKTAEDEKNPIESPAADFIAGLAENYSPQNPLYIVAIGAITNVASAILKNPNIKENCVIVWLGGHAFHIPNAGTEFNMGHDKAAARIVFGSGAPVVLLPCYGVVDCLTTSKYEMEHWLKGKNALCDYLYTNTVSTAEAYAKDKPWTRVIWDVSAIAWLFNQDGRFMREKLVPAPILEYDHTYAVNSHSHLIKYVYKIDRDAIFEDLFKRLAGEKDN